MKNPTKILEFLIFAHIICIGKADTNEDEPTVKRGKFETDEYDSSSFNDEMANYYISSDFFKNSANSRYLKETLNSLLKAKDDEQVNSSDSTSNSTHNPIDLLKSMLEGFMVVANPTENITSTTTGLPNPFTVTKEPLLGTSSKTIKPNRPIHPTEKITEQSTMRVGKNNSFIEEKSNKQSNLDIYKPVFIALAEHCDQMKMAIEELKLKQQNLKKENQDLYQKFEALQTNFIENLRSQNEITGKKLESIKNQQNDEKNYILKVAATLINIEDRLLKENELSLKEIELENLLTKTELLQQKMNATTEQSEAEVKQSTTEHPNVKAYENILHNFILEQDFKNVTPKMPTSHGLAMSNKVTDAVTHKPTEVFKSDIAKMISQIVRIHKNGSQEKDKVTEEGTDKTTEQYDLTFLK